MIDATPQLDANHISKFFSADQEISYGTLTIRGVDLPTVTGLFEQSRLNFFVQNPRIYSILRGDGLEPSQQDIFDALKVMEHVRQLILDIKDNGGLVEPLIVKPETMEVLEGNSRLAAYRFLAKNNPVKWAKAKVTFLPAGVDEETIFALLGFYHIKGKKDWSPYEQAGFLYRRYKQHGHDIKTVAAEIGMKTAKASLAIETFAFMVKQREPARRWSYYEEYFKSRKIKSTRALFPNFDDLIVDKIKSGEIESAVELRDKLPSICTAPSKIINQFAEGLIDFEEAYEKFVDAGADNTIYKRLNKFRLWLVETDFEKAIASCRPEERKRIAFEVQRLRMRLEKLDARKSV